MRLTVVLVSILILSSLNAHVDPSPIHKIMNLNSDSSLVNSVDFHPSVNRFCVTFTQNNSVVIYQLDEKSEVIIFQVLQNGTNLDCPQHALFSKDGNHLFVTNWCNQTFTVYQVNMDGFYQEEPIATLPFLLPTGDFRPHGMAFSPDGKMLAVAYGASKLHPRAIALYQINAVTNFTMLSLLQENEIEEGIPKGIAFSPDGSSLLVTFVETDSVAVYTIDESNDTIIFPPKELLMGPKTGLSRPEDIKFTANGKYCAVSNSNKNSITFYEFDSDKNRFVNAAPTYILENPESQLSFPHGLAFSSDGNYFVATQFGLSEFDENDNLSSWGDKKIESVNVYSIIKLPKK